jgi:4-diphosphocytidyl-2-C-methyl-D-erythritol kinase
LNLFLRVLGRRPDGYHEIESIFHGIDLGDDIDICPTTTGEVDVRMRLDRGLVGELPRREENLITHAAQRLLERGGRNDGVMIDVTKRIPMGAGLGGGSGNAAGALIALNDMWGMQLDRETLTRIALDVGSDVPYCLSGGTALATARGEQLTPLPSPDPMCFVLGISHQRLLTRDVYNRWDELEPPEEVGSAPMTLAVGSGDPTELASLLHNDLEPAAVALRPELADKKQAMIDAGALGAAVTGSGPTIFGIAWDEDHARSIALGVAGAFDAIVVAKTSERCVERLD